MNKQKLIGVSETWGFFATGQDEPTALGRIEDRDVEQRFV